jgi:hypothetical protein
VRVLFVGHCGDQYVGYLNNLVKENFAQSVTGVVDLFYPGSDIETRKKKYDYNYSLQEEIQKVKSLSLFQRVAQTPWKFVLKSLLTLNITELKLGINRIERQKVINAGYSKVVSKFNPTHVHVHYLDKSRLKWVEFIPQNCKVILTFWGSDLMTTSGGVDEYKIQYNALRRADVITTQTIDLRTILLCKFGQELLPKIRHQTFDPLLNKTGLIKNFATRESRDKLKSKYGIDANKKCIQVGYSSAIGQNHLKILEQIHQLPQEHKGNLAVFVPLSYNAEGDYIANLLNEIKKMDFQILPILEYISDEEMLAIVSACEVFIAMRENDALNAAMIESLYAGNLVVTGSWLPYGVYDRKKLEFVSLDSIEELSSELNNILTNYSEFKKRLVDNAVKLERLYSPSDVAKNWSKIYY